MIRPLARQFDPGPSSPLALEIWEKITSERIDALKQGNTERSVALDYLAWKIEPALRPFLSMSVPDAAKEDDEEFQEETVAVGSLKKEVNSDAASSASFSDVDTIKSAAATAMILHNAYDLLSRMLAMYRSVLKGFLDGSKHAAIIDEVATKWATAKMILERFGNPLIDEEYASTMLDDELRSEPAEITRKKSDHSGLAWEATTTSNRFPFLPGEERELKERIRNPLRKEFSTSQSARNIVDACKSIKRRAAESKQIDVAAGAFVRETCDFVEGKIRAAWKIGLNLDLESYRWDLETNVIWMRVRNEGSEYVSVGSVYVDGPHPFLHQEYLIHVRENPVPVGGTSMIEVFDVKKVEKGSKHKVTIVAGLAEFDFELIAGRT